MANNWKDAENDFKHLKHETINLLSNLEKSLENFEQNGDPTKLKNDIKKSITKFKINHLWIFIH